jgi:hypothetical protein
MSFTDLDGLTLDYRSGSRRVILAEQLYARGLCDVIVYIRLGQCLCKSFSSHSLHTKLPIQNHCNAFQFQHQQPELLGAVRLCSHVLWPRLRCAYLEEWQRIAPSCRVRIRRKTYLSRLRRLPPAILSSHGPLLVVHWRLRAPSYQLSEPQRRVLQVL